MTGQTIVLTNRTGAPLELGYREGAKPKEGVEDKRPIKRLLIPEDATERVPPTLLANLMERPAFQGLRAQGLEVTTPFEG